MFTLKNSGLTVSILDPQVDQEKLGSRYCCGGYVWQVLDEQFGDLLSGPCYPNPTNAFDGQGWPDAFEIAMGQDSALVGESVCVLGVGEVRRSSSVRPFHVRDNPEVLHFDTWDCRPVNAQTMEFLCQQKWKNREWEIRRTLRLEGRRLISTTEVKQIQGNSMTVRWFSHPFFPLHSEWASIFSLEMQVPENPGFFLDGEGRLCRRPDYDWKKGCFQPCALPFGSSWSARQAHPLLGEVKVVGDFPLAYLPVWGNANTFSFEPYLHQTLVPNSSVQWSLSMEFPSL
jgi:hypothetical protein